MSETAFNLDGHDRKDPSNTKAVSSTQYTATHWGTYEVGRRADGAPVLTSFRRDPDPCALGTQLLDPELQGIRVKRPAIRSSWLRSGPGFRPDLRGREPFVEVPWDEALDLAASELKRVQEQFGNTAIFGGSYGWASAGRFHHALGQVHRFLNAMGGFVRHVGSYSLGAADILMPHIVAPMDELMATHSTWDVLAKHTELFVTFGGVPIKNMRVNAGGVGVHRGRQVLEMMRRAGTRFVNIGPVRDNLGDPEFPAQWIACRPNSDTAAILAIAYVIVAEDLHDRQFLNRCCVGFDAFSAYLLGEQDGVPKTPRWAESITGIPAATTESLAREMAASRTMLNISWSLQRASRGEQTFAALVTLAAVLGQIGLAGGGFGLGYGAINYIGSPSPRIKGPTFSQGRNAVQAFIPVARIADMLLHPGEQFVFDGGTYAYPKIKLIYWAGGNPFHHHQDLNRLQRAWQKPDTIIVNEQYWTATAKRADIVFPATTTLERDDVGSATRESFIVAMKKLMKPEGEARDDHAIFCGLAERLGLREAFTEGLDSMGWIRRIYEDSRTINLTKGIEMPSFDTFWSDGIADLTPYEAPSTMLEDFVADPKASPLSTPSGKIEITSQRIAGFGLEDCPGYPSWIEPEEWLGSPASASFPIHLISDQPSVRLHSQLDPGTESLRAKIRGREPVHLDSRQAPGSTRIRKPDSNATAIPTS